MCIGRSSGRSQSSNVALLAYGGSIGGSYVSALLVKSASKQCSETGQVLSDNRFCLFDRILFCLNDAWLFMRRLVRYRIPSWVFSHLKLCPVILRHVDTFVPLHFIYFAKVSQLSVPALPSHAFSQGSFARHVCVVGAL